jgi:hypothetical protein
MIFLETGSLQHPECFCSCFKADQGPQAKASLRFQTRGQEGLDRLGFFMRKRGGTQKLREGATVWLWGLGTRFKFSIATPKLLASKQRHQNFS